jgi:hypothetical protein
MARQFLTDLAQLWSGPAVRLHIIGATALALQMPLPRRTRDADVFELVAFDPATRDELLGLAGRGTALAARHGMYVEIVPNGIPFLPRPPRWCPIALADPTAAVSVVALDVVDVVVSKLKRFHGNDKSDIGTVVLSGRVSHAQLVDRFRSAVDGWIGDANEDQLPRYVRNLHEVERDMLFVDESDIELPSWIDE